MRTDRLLANVSRRSFLGGAGALVLAVRLPGAARAQDAAVKKFGADAMPNGWRPPGAAIAAVGRRSPSRSPA